MDSKSLISFLLGNLNVPTVSDIYWNDVLLCLHLDKDSNTRGLPLYRDYSRYSNNIRTFSGTDINSGIIIPTNGDSTYPVITNTNTNTIQSFAYIANKNNHLLRQSELNSLTALSTVKPTYIEHVLSGNDYINIGTGDFTIEFSFYADEVALPWRFQTIYCQGSCFYGSLGDSSDIQTYLRYAAYSEGYGTACVLDKSDLIFFANGDTYKINNTPLIKLTWYYVCIQRIGNTLKTYINFNLINSYSFTKDLTYTHSLNSDTYLNRLRIGSCETILKRGYNNNPFYNNDNHIDTSFSGGLSNFRITKQARYAQNFYSTYLPFPILPVGNKIDINYANVLFNIPASFDYFDYSLGQAHFTDSNFLSSTPEFNSGFIKLTGTNSYTTKKTFGSLSNSEWTIEFYLTKLDNETYTKQYPASTANQPLFNNFADWLNEYQIQSIYSASKFNTKINLLSISESGKKVLNIDFNFIIQDKIGSYLSVSASQDGTNWLNFDSEANEDWNEGNFFHTTYMLPNNEAKFLVQHNGNAISGLPTTNNIVVPTGYDDPTLHIAVSRYNNVLYLLINGVVQKTLPFNYQLYSDTGCALTVGNIFTPLKGRKLNGFLTSLGLAVKGIRVTNKAIYTFINTASTPNNFFYSNSTQPLSIGADTLPPARARIVSIIKTITLPSISSGSCSWNVLLNQPIDNLVLADFSLSALGVTNYSLTNLVKVSDYVYTLTANTGLGNGSLTPNFIDRHTVKYKNLNKYISYTSGELNFTGDTYVINKNAPLPILTSGSSPYIDNAFVLTLTFDGAIQLFDITKLGVENGTITSVQTIDSVNQIYDITVTPNIEGAVIVQALEGLGTTDGNIPTGLSTPLVRIFSTSFPIFQLPLNITSGLHDYSPDRLLFNEIIPNNTQYSTSIAPIGDTSSLYVQPLLEQSGLYYKNFNAVASTLDTLNDDFTIEFFLRSNSTNNKISHILSVENAQSGFCIAARNGQLVISRSIDSSTNLIGGSSWIEGNYYSWNDTAHTQLEKYPHYAVSRKDGVYRFYRNGIRIGLVESTTLIDITQGDIYVGYYQNRVDDNDYYLSNVRLTLGKALYTSYNINVPGLPYSILPNITDSTSLLNFVSIYSNNYFSNKALTGDTVTCKFSSIITLTNSPIVTILGRPATVTKGNYNTYTAIITTLNTDIDGQVPFTINIQNEPGLSNTSFNTTTNNSAVFVDNTAVTASIGSSSPNNNYYTFDAYIQFSEAISSFNLNNLTISNCVLSNLFKYENENKYTFTVSGITTGILTIQLTDAIVTDLAGNHNTHSNTFSRNVVVPAYIPDSHYSNVLLLLQPTTNIIDESSFNRNVTATNVTISNTTSPANINKALYFNGIDSSLTTSLSSTLSSQENYTIEFFVYMNSATVFRLTKPTGLPASNVNTTKFTANWGDVDDASSYVIDVAPESNFDTYIPGFKNVNVGNNTTYNVTSTKLDAVPTNIYTKLLTSSGFLAKWDFVVDDSVRTLGYTHDIALDSNFNSILYEQTNRFTSLPYFILGKLTDSTVLNPLATSNSIDDSNVPYTAASGVILSGLLSNSNYPKLYYFLEESSIRLYGDSGYSLPAIAEDIDTMQWNHIAIVNGTKYTYLYVNGELQDKIKHVGLVTDLDIGYDIGHINGYLTGLRITKGIARYSGNSFTVPTLPFSKN